MIHQLQFSIEIKARASIIWKTLWDDNSYREWISTFSKGSYYLTDRLEQGSSIMFLAPDLSGIYSVIQSHIPNEMIQFKHIGLVANGEKQPMDAEVKKWTGTTEKYTLVNSKHYVTLLIDIDVLDQHVEFMTSKFPIALELIKQNSESIQ